MAVATRKVQTHSCLDFGLQHLWKEGHLALQAAVDQSVLSYESPGMSDTGTQVKHGHREVCIRPSTKCSSLMNEALMA